MPGVIDVVVVPAGGAIVPNPPGVAVMAETFGQAWDAANALDVTWGDGPLKGQIERHDPGDAEGRHRCRSRCRRSAR